MKIFYRELNKITISYMMGPVFLAVLLLVACSNSDTTSPVVSGEDEEMTDKAEGKDSVFFAYELRQVVENTITISTDSLSESTGQLNKDHTCEGRDNSPPLKWAAVPEEALSLALILEDPASDELEGLGLWTHWVLYSIPARVSQLEGNQPPMEVLENGAKQGQNDYKNVHYSGPCPKPTIMYMEGTDFRSKPELAKVRPYFFKLYALDKKLDLGPGATRDTLLEEIDGHIIAAGELSVPYKSKKREYKVGGKTSTSR